MIYTLDWIITKNKFIWTYKTLTEASILIGEFYKRGEVQNVQQHQNAPNKFATQ